MKHRYLVVVIFLASLTMQVFSQGATWTWMGGDIGTNSPTIFGGHGTQGVASPNNKPPALYEATHWTDKNGNLWMFGGHVIFSNNVYYFADVWKYDITSGMWTWVNGPGTFNPLPVYGTQGIPSPSNNPGGTSYGAVGWTDTAGNFWLFGGYGYYPGGAVDLLNTLWKYDITTNQWTFMKGNQNTNTSAVYGTLNTGNTLNTPGGRNEVNSGWTDVNNNLWLFGGAIGPFGSNGFSDMWQFNTATNNWIWKNGPQGTDNPPTFGTLNVPSSANIPSGRNTYTRWQDENGNFYIYGGKSHYGILNDVWKYNTISNQWAWISGDSATNKTAKYGTYCTPGNINYPGGRTENRTTPLAGCTNTFITYGGFTFVPGGIAVLKAYSDLWTFNTQTRQWTWISGADTLNDPGFYGVKGVASPYNLPPARFGNCIWTDKNNNLWIYGGQDASGNVFNDLWKCTLDPVCIGTPLNGGLNYTVTKNVICPGDSVLATFTSGTNLHISPSNSVIWIDSMHARITPRETTTYLVTGSSACNTRDSSWITITLAEPGIVTYSLSADNVCNGGTVSLNLLQETNVHITPAQSVTWADSSLIFLHPDTTTNYYITSLSACGWHDTSTVTVQVEQYQPVSMILADSAVCANTQAELTVTGLHSINISPFPNYAQSYFRDSSHIELTAPGSWIITGTTSCLTRYSDTVVLKAIPRQVNFTLGSNIICRGDSTLLTLATAAGFSIKPLTGVRQRDSTHFILSPHADINYTFYQPSVCGGIDSSVISMHVIVPGVIDYTLSPALVCAQNPVLVNLWGVSNPQPSNFDSVGPFHYQLSFTAYPPPYSITITGHSYCGGPDTLHLSFPALATPSYTLSKNFICKGDTSELSFTGLLNPVITPTTGVTWVDSAHILLSPDSSITYLVTATTCQGPAYYSIPLQVGSRRNLDYTASPSVICPGTNAVLTVTHTTNVSISPTVALTVTADSTTSAYLSPPVTTSYTLIGRSTCGFTDTSHFTIHVISSNNEIFTASTICRGDTDRIVLKGAFNLSVVPAYNIAWLDSSIDSSHLALFPDTTTNYTIFAHQCSGYALYDNFTVNVDTPGRFNYSVTNPGQCAGLLTYLNIYGISNATLSPPASSLHWADSTDVTAYLYPDTVTTYTVTGTSVCRQRDTMQITIRPSAPVSATLSRNIICAGDTALLTVVSFNYPLIQPIAGVYWIDSTHAWLHPVVTTTYFLYGNICGGTTNSFDSVTLIVQPQHQLHVTLSDTNICAGQRDTLTVSGTSAFSLNPTSQFSATGNDSFLTVLSPSVTTNYILLDSSGCGTGNAVHFKIAVQSGSPAYTLSDTAICKGDSVILHLSNASTPAITPANRVDWLSINTASLLPDTSTWYHITARSTCVNSYSDSFMITVFNPVVHIAPGAAEICSGDTATICASPAFPHYSWSSGYTTQCIKTTLQGNYNVTVTDQHNCTAKSNQAAVTIYPVLQSTITTKGDTLIASPGSTYQWYFNGTAISGATSYEYILKARGSYTVMVTDSNGCSSTSNPAIINGLEDIAGDGIQIYPNPLLSGNWHLKVYQQLVGSSMELFDESGQLITKGIVNSQDSEIEITAAGGVYFLRLQSTNSCIIKKLIKL